MNKHKIQPLGDRVLVQADIQEERSKGGIIIPDTAKEKPQAGTVMAVGKGKKDLPMTVKNGDKVLFTKYSGTEVVLDGKNLLIMKESEIYGILQ